MGSSMMKELFKIRSLTFYWAGKGFIFRGVYVWTNNQNVRVIALNRFSNWTGKYDENLE